MSTTTGNAKSFKFTDQNGNIFILTPVDSEARQAIDESKNLVFDDGIFKVEETNDEVNVSLANVPFGISENTPLRIDQDNENGLVLGSDALYAVAATATVYDATSGTYSVGDYCTYLGKIYKCTTDINPAEAWNPSHWTEVRLVDMINLAISDSVQPADLDNLIVTTYSSSSSYAVGDYCIYNKALYRCTTAITTAEAWTPGHWTAIHDIIAEAKKVRVISSNASDDITSGTVLTTVVYSDTYKEITVADTVTNLIITIDDAISGILQQTGFQFTLGANSVLTNVEVHRGNYKLPIIGDINLFTPGQTYQGTIVNGLVTIVEFDPPSRLSINVGGRNYPYVKIGDQLWTAENLDFIWNGLTFSTSAVSEQRFAYPNNQESNRERFGLLYNWYAASYLHNNKSTLLPDGWDVPDTSAYDKLIEFAGGSSVAGGKLRSREYSGTDNYGFNALMAGYIYFSNGSGSPQYRDFEYAAYFFTRETGGASSYGYSYEINTSNNVINKYNGMYKVYYHSIRLVKSLT